MPQKIILPVLDGLSAAIFIIDGNRKITFVNKSGRKNFGPNLVDLDFVQVIRNPDCLKAIDKVIHGKKSLQLEIGVQGTILTTYKVNISRLGAKSIPENLKAKNSDNWRAIISLEDISPIREALTMRSDFVANVSHELRSPLTAISGFIETLKGSAKDDHEAREKFLIIMEEQSQRMVRLIDDLLSLSKVQASEHLLPKNSVDLIAIIKQTIATLSPLAAAENVKINLEIAENIEAMVKGERDQLLQVFLNLVENAIKYGGDGNQVDVVLSAKAKAPGIAGPAFMVEIIDQGIGIPREHLPRLTERFYRVDTGRSRQKGGTGLGLAIVKHIVARHRGRLQIKNNDDRGASFSVFLSQ
ncbi:MAG: ATP-binding protein [Devosiaceae bacterium]|nr:ATP-binding protein [Devosiaceae bacterium]